MRLKELRLSKGLTQKDIAIATGLSQPFISYLESGIKMPDLGNALILAKVLGVTVEELVGRETSENGA